MISKLLKVISSIIFMCMALNFIPAVAKSEPELIPGPADRVANTDVPLESTRSDIERFLPVELEEVKRAKADILPSHEDLARTAEQVRAFDCTSVTDVSKADCEALVALYGSTNGAGWSRNNNWLTDTSVATWSGISVSADHVYLIELGSNLLTGNIPPELGTLTSPLYIRLGHNSLRGSIPPELGNLTSLLELDLNTNRLTGSIPSEMGNLIHLRQLLLGSNQLNGSIPLELANLSELQILNLPINQLSGSIPSWLGSLENLKEINLDSNQLSGSIPPELGSLDNLWYLSIYDNLVSGSIPSELGNLANLSHLYLDSNRLNGSIPLNFVNLSKMNNFYFSGNLICEPTDPEFLTWKATVFDWQGTIGCGTFSSYVYLPSLANGYHPLPGEMIYIPAGDFQMGCNWPHNFGFDCGSDEVPLHTVNLDAYYIDQTEVTNSQYAECVEALACDPPSISSQTRDRYYNNSNYAEYPVLSSWYDAIDYCTWVGKRLPTEAEWEKAAKGTSLRAYPWGDYGPTCSDTNGGYCVGDTSRVGIYPSGASPYGALDMAGNVWEWVQDWYLETYYSDSPVANPPGPASGLFKVMRGGSWKDSWGFLRVADRKSAYPFFSDMTTGFRCASSTP